MKRSYLMLAGVASLLLACGTAQDAPLLGAGGKSETAAEQTGIAAQSLNPVINITETEIKTLCMPGVEMNGCQKLEYGSVFGITASKSGSRIALPAFRVFTDAVRWLNIEGIDEVTDGEVKDGVRLAVAYRLRCQNSEQTSPWVRLAPSDYEDDPDFLNNTRQVKINDQAPTPTLLAKHLMSVPRYDNATGKAWMSVTIRMKPRDSDGHVGSGGVGYIKDDFVVPSCEPDLIEYQVVGVPMSSNAGQIRFQYCQVDPSSLQ